MSILDQAKQEYTDYLSKVEEAKDAVHDAIAGAEETEVGLKKIGEAVLELKRVVSYDHPGVILRTPTPSLDPEHPQGLGRKLQPGETLQDGVV